MWSNDCGKESTFGTKTFHMPSVSACGVAETRLCLQLKPRTSHLQGAKPLKHGSMSWFCQKTCLWDVIELQQRSAIRHPNLNLTQTFFVVLQHKIYTVGLKLRMPLRGPSLIFTHRMPLIRSTSLKSMYIPQRMVVQRQQ